MFLKNLEVLTMARGLARHAATAQSLSAQNIANADTPGYRAKQIRSFDEVWQMQGQGLKATRAKHLNIGQRVNVEADTGLINDSPNKNSVSLEAEMMASARNRQSHDMALTISKSLSGVLRQSLAQR